MATNWVDEVLSGATSTGSKTLSLATGNALSVANSSSENLFTVTSDTSNGGYTSILGIEGQEAILFLGADNADDAGDVWQIQADASGNLKIGNRTSGTGSPTRSNTIVDAITIDSSRNISVGVDDTGYDVKFFGATSGQYMLWDESADELVLAGDSKLSFHDAAGGENIIATSDGHLEINAGTTLDITAPTVDVNASSELNIDGNVDLNGTLDVSSTSTLTGLVTATAGVKLGNNTIYASDGGATITLDTSDNVTIAGDLTVTGNTLTFGNNEVVHNEADSHMYIRTQNFVVDAATASHGVAYVVAQAQLNYDSKFALYDGAAIRWSMGQDYSDSAKLKFDYGNDTVGAATKLTLDSSGNMTVAGDLIVAGGVTSGTSSNVHSLHVSDGSSSSMNMGNEAEIVITDDGIPRIYFEDTGEGTNDKLMAIANYNENFVVQSLVDDGESYDVENILVCNRDGNVSVGSGDFSVIATKKIYLDGGTHTYFHESSSDVVQLAGGVDQTTAVRLINMTPKSGAGAGNTVYGEDAGSNLDSDSIENTYFGAKAGDSTHSDGDSNTGIGYISLTSCTTGDHNTAVGKGSLYALTEGTHNLALGSNALDADTKGKYSVALGYGALTTQNFTSLTDTYNTSVGAKSGWATTTGIKNTFLGGQAGESVTTGSENICIGYNAEISAVDTDNEIVIGSDATGLGANKIVLGDATHTDIYLTEDQGAAVWLNHINMLERSSDPTEPAEGHAVVWMSDGTGKGDDGDIMIASQAGGATKYATLFDHSGGSSW